MSPPHTGRTSSREQERRSTATTTTRLATLVRDDVAEPRVLGRALAAAAKRAVRAAHEDEQSHLHPLNVAEQEIARAEVFGQRRLHPVRAAVRHVRAVFLRRAPRRRHIARLGFLQRAAGGGRLFVVNVVVAQLFAVLANSESRRDLFAQFGTPG